MGAPPWVRFCAMATIERRGESTRVNWRLGGSRTGARQSCTFRGPEKARTKLADAAKHLVESRNHSLTRDEVYKAVLGAPDEHASVPTLAAWIVMWIAERTRLRDIQPDGLARYKQVLESRVVPYMGHLRLTEIDEEVLRGWIAWMSGSRVTMGSRNRRDGHRLVSGNTVRKAHAILHMCLGAAVPKYLTVNPAARPAGSAKHKTGLPKVAPFEGMFLSPEEVRMIVACCDDAIRDLVEVAFHTGLRMGELVALEVRHVLFSATGATILVRQALKGDGTFGPPKSVRSHREITVGHRIAGVLRRRCSGRRPGALVFPAPRGGVWCENNLRERYWYRAVAQAQRCVEHPPPVPLKPKRGPVRRLRHDEVSMCACPTRLHRRPRFHDSRHTHASVLIARGWSAKKVQHRLGHASYQTTMNVYGHLMNLGDPGELDDIDALLSAPVPTKTDRVRRRPRRGGSSVRPGRGAACRRTLVRR